MKRVVKIVNRVQEFNLLIPFEGSVSAVLERGATFKKGDKLFEQNYKRILVTYYLPKELSAGINEVREYIVRLDGEYVSQGEVIAEKLVTGGLNVKKVYAIADGILSLARIEQGYVDILSESNQTEFISSFYGKVVDIDYTNGMTVSTPVYILRGRSNTKGESEVSGTFKFVKEGDSIYSYKDLEQRYDGSIVFAGRYVTLDMITQLYMRGASHVMVYSMEYSDFIQCEHNISVLGGFGKIAFAQKWYKALSQMNGEFLVVKSSGVKSDLIFPDSGKVEYQASRFGENIVEYLRPGLDVKLKDVSAFNVVGKVADISAQEGYVTVETNDNQMILVPIEAVDVVSM